MIYISRISGFIKLCEIYIKLFYIRLIGINFIFMVQTSYLVLILNRIK